MISEQGLINIGCARIHWNTNWNGGYFEYFLRTQDRDPASTDWRLSVTFGDLPDRPFMVWLVVPSTRIALKHITTIEDFLIMYRFVTGKDLLPS